MRQTYHRLGNHFGCTRLNSKATWVMWNLVSICLEIVLVLVQDRSTVCAKCNIGSEIVLDAPDGTPRCCGSLEPRFDRFGDSVSVGAR